MAEAAFLELLTHVCDIGIESDSGTDTHGHPTLTLDDDAEAGDHPCLWQESRSGTQFDRYSERIDFDGILFIEYDGDVDETRVISNIRDADGVVLEPGPLRIVWSRNAGGQQHHLQLYCKRSAVLAVS